ncbi:hypothetical protein OG590_40210 (plasmid) [Streptomyces goshikiensis]|nr:hypothetical protein OG590_40210 [Streptomyces goshikiensis]
MTSAGPEDGLPAACDGWSDRQAARTPQQNRLGLLHGGNSVET